MPAPSDGEGAFGVRGRRVDRVEARGRGRAQLCAAISRHTRVITLGSGDAHGGLAVPCGVPARAPVRAGTDAGGLRLTAHRDAADMHGGHGGWRRRR